MFFFILELKLEITHVLRLFQNFTINVALPALCTQKTEVICSRCLKSNDLNQYLHLSFFKTKLKIFKSNYTAVHCYTNRIFTISRSQKLAAQSEKNGLYSGVFCTQTSSSGQASKLRLFTKVFVQTAAALRLLEVNAIPNQLNKQHFSQAENTVSNNIVIFGEFCYCD